MSEFGSKSQPKDDIRDFTIVYRSDGSIDLDATRHLSEARINAFKEARQKEQRRNTVKATAGKLAGCIGVAIVYGLVSSNVGNSIQEQKFDDTMITSDSPTPIEESLAKVATQITGVKDINVICDADLSLFDNNPKDNYAPMGVTLYPKRTESGKTDVLLDYTFCNFIEYAEQVEKPSNVAFATFSFAHELGHVTGEHDEGKTNCLAVDLFPEVRDMLGLTEILKGFDPLDGAKLIGSPEYHSAGC